MSAFFASGSRFRGNNFTLDGQTNNDESASGIPVITPTVETVQEFRVLRNNFSAEFGTHSGSVINVVTKSGVNQFHGSAWEFHRNDALDAGEVFDPFNDATGEKDKAPLVQNQFGFTLGGPIAQDRLFFFGSYEGFRRRGGESSVSTRALWSLTTTISLMAPRKRGRLTVRISNSIRSMCFTSVSEPGLHDR